MAWSRWREPVNVQALWDKEKALSKRKRRARYRCGRDFVRLNDIVPWTIYATQLRGYEDIHTKPELTAPTTVTTEPTAVTVPTEHVTTTATATTDPTTTTVTTTATTATTEPTTAAVATTTATATIATAVTAATTTTATTNPTISATDTAVTGEPTQNSQKQTDSGTNTVSISSPNSDSTSIPVAVNPEQNSSSDVISSDNISSNIVKPVTEKKAGDDDDENEESEEEKFLPNHQINRKLSVWRGDITRLEIDAIVNAANNSLLGGGGIDGAIHRAAGGNLVDECSTLGGAATGQTKITRGYDLPSLYVLHTVGPVGENEDKLISCYSTCLDLVLKHNIKDVAFCGISTGIFGYPLYAASHVACRTIRQWMENPENLAKVDRIIFCTFLAKEEVCYNELLPKYFPPVRDPEFVAEYTARKQTYTSSVESSETDEEEEEEEEEEDDAGEEGNVLESVKQDMDQLDQANKDAAPPLIFGKASIQSSLREIVITIPANGFQAKWKTVHYMLTPRGAYSQLFVKLELKQRQFIVATADQDRTAEVHFDWILHGSE